MIELVVAGYLLTGTVCEEADRKFCRYIPTHSFGGQYACDRKRDELIERFPAARPDDFGFAPAARLDLKVGCAPTSKPGL